MKKILFNLEVLKLHFSIDQEIIVDVAVLFLLSDQIANDVSTRK